MQESDQILIASLRQAGFTVPQTAVSVADLNNDDVLSVCIQLLDMFGVDTTSIKQLGRTQKFRIATKINQELTKHVGTQFELNDLMNTNINNVRKILMLLLSKLSMLDRDNKAIDQQYVSNQERTKKDNIMRKERVWKTWLGREWVHPSLQQQKDVKFESHRLRYDLNEEIEKKNILKDFEHPRLRCNMQAILTEMYSLYSYTKKKISAEEGIRINAQNSAEANLDVIRENNRSDWTVYKDNNKKANKLKKKLLEARPDENPREKTKEDAGQPKQATVFQQQVEELVQQDRIQAKTDKTDEDQMQLEAAKHEQDETEKVDPLVKVRTDIEKIKRNHEKEIDAMLQMVQQKEAEIKALEQTEIKTDEEIVKKEEQIQKFKVTVVTAKKQTEKKQLLLNSVDEPDELTKEVASLTEEVKQLQAEAKSEVDRMQAEIKALEQEGTEKLEILNDMKEKLVKIEHDYAKVVRDLAEKQQQKQFIKIPQGGISRNHYNKRITEMDTRWKEGRREIQKAEEEIARITETIAVGASTATRIETEIENLLNMDKNKNDALNKLIREQYDRYKSTYKDTVKAMNSVTEIRTESRQYEALASELSGKNYKVNIEKLKFALEDIRKERELNRRRK